MGDAWTFISENILPHWPFVVGYFGFVLVGQFVKAQIWTKQKASTPGKGQKFFHFMRRTLSMHAPVVGLLVGLVPSVPVSPGVDGLGAHVLYWFGIGVASSFTFHAGSEWIKGKTDGKLDLEASIERAVSPDMKPDESKP